MTERQHIKHIRCEKVFGTYPDILEKKKKWISQNINFEVQAGEILAIMGPSGSGKSTLLNAVLGRLELRRGDVHVNGVHQETGLAAFKQRVGLVPQDDILVDELTVRENIAFFHTIAVDSNHSEIEVNKRISNCLNDLGIYDEAEKRVAEPGETRKNISGGQRKRANIAMELVNEPDVLIIDEPTSGLSSQDSLSLIENLRKIADGETDESGKVIASPKIVIIIIHQPSSDIFKLFDRLMLLDGEGHCVRSGPRDDVVKWFETRTASKCSALCGESEEKFYFPDRLLASLETRKSWKQESEQFEQEFTASPSLLERLPLPKVAVLRSPFESFKDFSALVKRQVHIKLRDRLSQLVFFAAPPLLGLIIAKVFQTSPGDEYVFANNPMFGQFLFMLIISAMFLGLVSSIFEVIKDRPILERESRRGLSMTTYYAAEFTTLGIFSAIQAFLLTCTSLWVIGADGYLLPNLLSIYLVMLLSAAIGLLISALFKSPIAAYNWIPIILVPQIILGGALMPFKDIGNFVHLGRDKPEGNPMPALAHVIPASWAYEMTAVANYYFAFDHNLQINKVLKEQIRKAEPGDFLAAQTTQSPDFLLDQLGLERYAGSTAARDGAVLLMLLMAIGLSGVIWVRREYLVTAGRRKLLPVAQVAVLILPFSLYNGMLTTAEHPYPAAPHWPLPDFTASKEPLTLIKANQYCQRKGKQIADFTTTLRIWRETDEKLRDGEYWFIDTGTPTSLEYRLINSAHIKKLPANVDDISELPRSVSIERAKSKQTTARALCVADEAPIKTDE